MKFDHNASLYIPSSSEFNRRPTQAPLTLVLPPASKAGQAKPILCSCPAERGLPAAGRDLCSLFHRSIADQKDFLSTLCLHALT